MKISSHFSAYALVSCLVLLMAVAINHRVRDDEIYDFIANVFGLRQTYLPDIVHKGEFTQRLDHYNRTEYLRTFQQNFFFNDKYYNDKVVEPTVLFVVAAFGQMDEMEEFFKDELYVEFAKRSEALMITLEPRFYGESQPFEDLRTENLFYLSTEQTLADLALFIRRGPYVLMSEHQINIPPNAKWVTIGRDYGGSLAAWFRLKFPHFAEASITVGGPALIMPIYTEYFDKVERSFYNDGILDDILGVLQHIKDKIENKDEKSWEEHKSDLDTLFKDFKMCAKLYREEEIEEDKKDIKYKSKLIQPNIDFMFFALTYQLGIMAQTRDPIFNEFTNISKEILMNKEKNIYDRVKNAVQYALVYTQGHCLETDYQKNVDLLKNTDLKNVQNPEFLPELLTTTMGSRNKFYQRCFEFGHFEGADEDNAFFPYIPTSFYTHLCTQVFKPSLDDESVDFAILATNVHYGAMLYAGKKALFINRIDDPNIGYEVRESNKKNERVAVIMKSLPASFLSSTKSDKERLKGYYYRIFEAFLEWVGKYDEYKLGLDVGIEENIIDVYEDEPNQTENIFEIEWEKYEKLLAEKRKVKSEEKFLDAHGTLKESNEEDKPIPTRDVFLDEQESSQNLNDEHGTTQTDDEFYDAEEENSQKLNYQDESTQPDDNQPAGNQTTNEKDYTEC